MKHMQTHVLAQVKETSVSLLAAFLSLQQGTPYNCLSDLVFAELTISRKQNKHISAVYTYRPYWDIDIHSLVSLTPGDCIIIVSRGYNDQHGLHAKSIKSTAHIRLIVKTLQES